ncbi:carbohydrate sulfotransferase 11-like [Lingula anatina]|uniref:Carbohydrate sulfotransferase n=1 Tax=Lingula anatina TaxID=7574 RepID=A0A1S3HBV1_LINAN|nr:carbohydrate sulfotransferase 11-like [Lingula anatina]|eukprot:XP_013383507.1 carbohydrate sulfotransferase 11-like [Lingula anatina]
MGKLRCCKMRVFAVVLGWMALVVSVVLLVNLLSTDRVIYGMPPQHRRMVISLSDEALAKIQEERQETVRKFCKANGIHPTSNVDPSLLDHLYVDDKHKLIYCKVPKVASTNFKRILVVAMGLVNTTDPMKISGSDAHEKHFIPKLSSYSPEEVRYRLDTYFKFMFVREPLERLVSAYRNKFTLPYSQYFQKVFGRKIVYLYRKNATKDSLKKGNDVTFEEFIRYLTDAKKSSEQLNEHWRPFYRLCHPCVIQYDIIGKYETLADDADYILRMVGLDDILSFPTMPPRTGLSTKERTLTMFQNLSPIDIHNLWELFSVDFALFGYEYPHFKGVKSLPTAKINTSKNKMVKVQKLTAKEKIKG